MVLLHPVFTQVWIELHELRLGIGIVERSRHRQTVIEQQQIPGAGESVLDGTSAADVVELRAIDVLDEVIAKPPLPDRRAATVDLDDRVDLRAVVAFGGIRVRTECDCLVMRQPRIGDIEDRVVIKLGVIDAQMIVMGAVVLARFGVLSERLTFPVPNGERLVA